MKSFIKKKKKTKLLAKKLYLKWKKKVRERLRRRPQNTGSRPPPGRGGPGPAQARLEAGVPLPGADRLRPLDSVYGASSGLCSVSAPTGLRSAGRAPAKQLLLLRKPEVQPPGSRVYGSAASWVSIYLGKDSARPASPLRPWTGLRNHSLPGPGRCWRPGWAPGFAPGPCLPGGTPAARTWVMRHRPPTGGQVTRVTEGCLAGRGAACSASAPGGPGSVAQVVTPPTEEQGPESLNRAGRKPGDGRTLASSQT